MTKYILQPNIASGKIHQAGKGRIGLVSNNWKAIKSKDTGALFGYRGFSLAHFCHLTFLWTVLACI